MSLAELLPSMYLWAELHAWQILAASALVPALGTLLAWIGKGGRTDRDGRAVASVLVGFGLSVFLLAVLLVVIAWLAFERSVIEAHLALLAAPLVCLSGCLAGIRLVFPLNELASVRTFTDIGLFVGACLAVLWLFSQFRGWGIVFFGGIGQLVLIAVLGYFLMRRLYRRAFRR